MSSQDPITTAQGLRFRLDTKRGPLSDVVEVVERQIQLPVIIDAFPAGVAGLLACDLGQYYIFVNGSDAPARQRFTVAHELGHWALEHGPRLDNDDSLASTDPQERDANRFASEFLMPWADLNDAWQEARVARADPCLVAMDLAMRYGVSFLMTRISLKNGDLISTAEYAKLEASDNVSARNALARVVDVPEIQDTITSATGSLPRLPLRAQDQIRRVHASGFLDRDALVARTGLPRAAVDSALAEADDDPPAA